MGQQRCPRWASVISLSSCSQELFTERQDLRNANFTSHKSNYIIFDKPSCGGTTLRTKRAPLRLGLHYIFVSLFSTGFSLHGNSSLLSEPSAGIQLPKVERRLTAVASIRSRPHLVPTGEELAVILTKAPLSVSDPFLYANSLFSYRIFLTRTLLTDFYVKLLCPRARRPNRLP